MVMLLQAIVALLNQRKNRVLRLAEASLPATQFRAFRGLVLDELGRGFEKDLERVLAEHAREGNRHGQADTRKEGGAP
jgi:hypothetical protein